MAYYKTIQGVKYDAGLLEQAQSLTEGHGDGRISQADAEALWEAGQDGKGVTKVEQRTFRYLLEEFKWTDKAREWFLGQLETLDHPAAAPTEAGEEGASADHHPEDATVLVSMAQAYYETKSRQYWETAYQAYLSSIINNGDWHWIHSQIDRELSRIPYIVRDAVDFYVQNVEGRHFGNVRLYKIHLESEDHTSLGGQRLEWIYLVQTTTGGNHGWVEMYGNGGKALSYGRTYLELVAWGHEDDIRATVHSGDFPAELEDRHERTLWGK